MAETYTVIYRTGGPARCKWHRTTPAHATRASAASYASDIERMGYKTLVHRTHILDAVGMPVGWEYAPAKE